MTGFGADIGRELIPDVSGRGEGKDASRLPQDALLAYMVRPPVAVNRILPTDKNKIIYKADHIHPRHGANFRFFDNLDFIAQIVQHIPDVHEKSVIYYGWYSNRTRGKRRAEAAESNAPSEEALSGDSPRPAEPQAPAAVRRAWAAMIKRVYEVDPLTCPECSGEMYIVSFIETSQIPAMHSVLVSGKM